MGDSVVWGNGNVEANKFTVKVAHYMADSTGRPTTVVVYAHSGALLAPIKDASLEPVPIDGAGVSQPDLNSHNPSTTEQEVCAAGTDKDAEIVILDGCINEVKATDIALPFPLNWTKENEIRRRAYVGCSKPMRQLLNNVSKHFQNATVVVLDYYQVVTADSKLLKEPLPGAPPEPAEKGTPKEATDELEVERRKLLEMSPEGKKQLQMEQRNFALGIQAWQANSKAFLETSMGCFKWAVAKVDGVPRVPDMPDAPPADLACPAAEPPAAQRATATTRIFLVELDNRPEFGYGVPHTTHQWRLPVPPADDRIDDMYKERKKLCEAIYHDSASIEGCKINAMAHPNREGAAAYTEKINSVLEKAWGAAP
jgi:hypothetical protein